MSYTLYLKYFKMTVWSSFFLISFKGLAQSHPNALYREKFIALFNSYPDSSKYYMDHLKASTHKDHDTVVAKDYNNFSIYHLYHGQKDSAFYYLKRSLDLCAPKNKHKTMLSLSVLHKKSGDYDRALELLNQVLSSPFINLKEKGIVFAEMASI